MTEPMSDSDSEDAGTQGGFGPVRRAKDKLKHSRNETRRRARIRVQFDELRQVMNCERKDRYSILQFAVEHVNMLQARLNMLESEGKTAPMLEKKKIVPLQKAVSGTTVTGNTSALTVTSPMFHNVAAAILGVEGNFLDCNAAFLSMFHGHSKQVLDKSSSLFTLTHPAHLTITFALMQEILSGRLQNYEAEHQFVDFKLNPVTARLVIWPLMEHGKLHKLAAIFVPKVSNTSSAMTAAALAAKSGSLSAPANSTAPAISSNSSTTSSAPLSPTHANGVATLSGVTVPAGLTSATISPAAVAAAASAQLQAATQQMAQNMVAATAMDTTSTASQSSESPQIAQPAPSQPLAAITLQSASQSLGSTLAAPPAQTIKRSPPLAAAPSQPATLPPLQPSAQPLSHQEQQQQLQQQQQQLSLLQAQQAQLQQQPITAAAAYQSLFPYGNLNSLALNLTSAETLPILQQLLQHQQQTQLQHNGSPVPANPLAPLLFPHPFSPNPALPNLPALSSLTSPHAFARSAFGSPPPPHSALHMPTPALNINLPLNPATPMPFLSTPTPAAPAPSAINASYSASSAAAAGSQPALSLLVAAAAAGDSSSTVASNTSSPPPPSTVGAPTPPTLSSFSAFQPVHAHSSLLPGHSPNALASPPATGFLSASALALPNNPSPSAFFTPAGPNMRDASPKPMA